VYSVDCFVRGGRERLRMAAVVDPGFVVSGCERAGLDRNRRCERCPLTALSRFVAVSGCERQGAFATAHKTG